MDSQTPKVEGQAAADTNDFGDKIIDGEYIVIFENQFDGRIDAPTAQQAEQLTNEIITSSNIAQSAVRSTYKYAIKGFSAKFSESKAKALRRDPRIKSVTPNVLFKLDYTRKSGSEYQSEKKEPTTNNIMANGESISWGVSRINGPLDGTGKRAWILDSGIDLDHPDLNVNVSSSVSFIATESADDQTGHGTHLAGILAAQDNSQDVVGVAAGAEVVSVKVCNSLPPSDPDSGCPTDAILDGIDYVSINAQPSDIVNMSFSLVDQFNVISSIDDAVTNAANAGIRFAISAGNDKTNAQNVTPARVENSNVWTVSAYDDTDTFATSFSNFGNPPIEYGGPGVDIVSLWKNGGTNTKSGTSQATPHIAGLLLAAPQDIIADGTVSNDPDGNADPIAFNPPPPSVTISGPGSLLDGQQGTWSASVEYGTGSYSYQWYYKNPGSANWFPGGSSSSFSKTFYSNSSTAVPAYVKVEATNGSQQLVDEYTVLISGSSGGGGGCPPGYICS